MERSFRDPEDRPARRRAQEPGDGVGSLREVHRMRLRPTVLLVAILAAAASAQAADLDRASVDFTTPAEIKWVRNAAGTNEQALLFGDPSKPGPYVVRVKWFPGNMSRPHFHPNDRFFAVLSGTWWMGTGETFDPDKTVPVPAGSYVVHYGGKVHFDGAKDEETILQVWGMGPATSTPAEKK
jgi:ChrR Cupin-like domain